jgi:hypothetical protein
MMCVADRSIRRHQTTIKEANSMRLSPRPTIVGRVGDELRTWRNTSTRDHPRIAPGSGVILGTGWNTIGKILTPDRFR